MTAAAMLASRHGRNPRRRVYPIGMRHEPQRSPVGEALAWASRIMAMGLAMALPAVAGSWLDARLGTGFLAVGGLVLGFVAGMAWVVQLAGKRPK